MASGSKQGGKMINFINHRFRVTLKDGRQLVGYMSAFDKHMNLVLADCEEYRRVKRKAKATGAPGAGQHGGYVETEEKRVLGFVILRGAHVVSTTVEGPPLSDPSARLGTSAPGGAAATLQTGPGISRPAGRGAGIGLQGPAAGVGGPGFAGAGFPPQQPGYGIPRGVPPMGFAPGVGLPPGGPPGFQPPAGFPPQGGRGFQGPPGGYPGR